MQIDVSPFASLDQARVWAKNTIDAAAGRARGRFVTVIHGQDAVYLAKYNEAISFLRAAGPVDAALYPWVMAEAVATGLPPLDVAERIKGAGQAWHTDLGPRIEGLRVGGKDKLSQLDTMAGVLGWTRQVCQQLDELQRN